MYKAPLVVWLDQQARHVPAHWADLAWWRCCCRRHDTQSHLMRQVPRDCAHNMLLL